MVMSNNPTTGTHFELEHPDWANHLYPEVSLLVWVWSIPKRVSMNISDLLSSLNYQSFIDALDRRFPDTSPWNRWYDLNGRNIESKQMEEECQGISSAIKKAIVDIKNFVLESMYGNLKLLSVKLQIVLSFIRSKNLSESFMN